MKEEPEPLHEEAAPVYYRLALLQNYFTNLSRKPKERCA